MASLTTSELTRFHPLENQLFAANNVLLKPVAAQTRLILRASADQVELVGGILGLILPTRPKTSTTNGPRTIMWLGPDEWLVFEKLKSSLHTMPKKLTEAQCSVVDVSHRNTAIVIKGKSAADVLNTGCPQDLSLDVFPVGACSRTVLGKSEIILLRLADDKFHVECWRSFSDYVWKYLVDGIKTL